MGSGLVSNAKRLFIAFAAVVILAVLIFYVTNGRLPFIDDSKEKAIDFSSQNRLSTYISMTPPQLLGKSAQINSLIKSSDPETKEALSLHLAAIEIAKKQNE